MLTHSYMLSKLTKTQVIQRPWPSFAIDHHMATAHKPAVQFGIGTKAPETSAAESDQASRDSMIGTSVKSRSHCEQRSCAPRFATRRKLCLCRVESVQIFLSRSQCGPHPHC